MDSLEDLGIISPDFRIEMQGIQDDHTVLTLGDSVFAAENLVSVFRGDTKCWSRRFEPQGLFEGRIDVLEFLEVFEFDGLVTTYFVDFLPDLLK